MNSPTDSFHILRTAAWIWLGFLLAMAVMDFVLYTPQIQSILSQAGQSQQQVLPNSQNQLNPNQLGNLPNRNPVRSPLAPVFFFYAANGIVALVFLGITYWDWIQPKFGRSYYPLLLFIISAAPIMINILIVPRFPQGPLSNAEGMALRQIPVLFVALALVAWEYQMVHVIIFGIATTVFELGLIYYFNPVELRSIGIFLFIAIIRTISFVAVGVFINSLVTRLRQQQVSLRQANADLRHYASTLEQLTVSRERNRLARELHDTLAHSLTAISVSLETAKAYFDIDTSKSRDLIDRSLEATRTGADETRRALKALRASNLEDLGIGLAIQRAAESTASRFHLDLELGLPNPMPSLSPDVEQSIYRITQEALENITNHSQAKKIKINFASDDHITLTIQDDGIGFDSKSRSQTGHFGLVGMRERAELAGGTLKVESTKGKGTTIVLTI